MLALDTITGARSRDVREAGARVLGCAAHRHGQLEAIAAALVDGLNKNEHLAAAAAEVAQVACSCFGDDRLVSHHSAPHKQAGFTIRFQKHIGNNIEAHGLKLV